MLASSSGFFFSPDSSFIRKTFIHKTLLYILYSFDGVNVLAMYTSTWIHDTFNDGTDADDSPP